jgi:hypothetical protein
MIIYRTKFVLNTGDVFYYVGKDVKNNKSYIGSGKLLPWFIKNSIYIHKTIIGRASSTEELNTLENYWLQKLKCAEQYNYLNIKGYSSGGVIITNRDKWLISLRLSTPKRVEAYKKTRNNWNKEKKREVSHNISIGVKNAFAKVSPDIKYLRKQKEMHTKKQRTPEQKKHESYLKSQSSKRAAKDRASDIHKQMDYSHRVSEGVKRWRNNLSADEITNITFKYKKTMYTKNGMLAYESQVREMIYKNTSIEIYHFLKSKNIKTHHICVKKFIDFLKEYSIIDYV